MENFQLCSCCLQRVGCCCCGSLFRGRVELQTLQLGMFSKREFARVVPVQVNNVVLRMRELLSQLLRLLLIMFELALQFFVGICRVLHHGLGLVRALPYEIAGFAGALCHACFHFVDPAASAGQLHG